MAKSPPTLPALCNTCRKAYIAATRQAHPTRSFSVLNRPPPKYAGHVPLTLLERAGLIVGSGLGSLVNPRRADLIAAFGEVTATPYFIYRLRDAMLASPTGRRILRDRPRLSSATIDVERLRALPLTTVGGAYAAWLDREGVSPDTRAAVRYLDSPTLASVLGGSDSSSSSSNSNAADVEECAYVMQRYRESHDFYHALTGLPTFREGEVALKAFEFANTLLPMTGLSVLAAATLKPRERRRLWATYLPWALRNGLRARDVINVYWEEEMERDVEDLRRELGIEQPPDLRETRRREAAERRRKREEAAEAR